jgi:hypothetical protein
MFAMKTALLHTNRDNHTGLELCDAITWGRYGASL